MEERGEREERSELNGLTGSAVHRNSGGWRLSKGGRGGRKKILYILCSFHYGNF